MRLLSLDVLRGVAVLLVLFRHSDTAWEPLRRGGWVGVDLFFVLSGFLVSGLLFREFKKTGTIRPGRFLLRRAWKIYPAFWVLVAVTLIFVHDWSKTIVELLFVQSYFDNRLWGHTWSLAVEEHFYVLLPILLVCLSRDQFRSLPRIVGMIMVGLLVAKCINGLRPYNEQTHLFPTHLRLDGLFFGVLLSYWHHNWEAFNKLCERHSRVLIAAGILLLSPAFIWDVETTPAIYTIGLTGQILGSGAILMGLVCGGVPTNRLTNSLGWIGQYSYSIYLWHNAVVVASVLLYPSAFFIVLGSVAVGAGMSKLVETPMLRLRDRLAAA